MYKQIFEFALVIAGPSDANAQRSIVFDAIEAWNKAHSAQMGLRIRAVGWEEALPSLAGDAQSIINREFGENYAALIAVFKARLGTPTPRSPKGSGTAEEIDLATSVCGHVIVFFYEGPAELGKVIGKDLVRLQNHKSALQKRGLLGSYISDEDLRSKVDLYLAKLAYEFQAQVQAVHSDASDQRNHPRPEDEAILKILPGENDAGLWITNVVDGLRAQVRYQIQNIGRAPARDVHARVKIGEGEPTDIRGPSILASLRVADREGLALPLPAPFPGLPSGPVPPGFPDSELIQITLFYSDFQHELGEKHTDHFCFRFARVAEGALWRSRVEPCAHGQAEVREPIAHPKPRNLATADHAILERLVRRAATKPRVFQPIVLTHRGDNSQLYALQIVPGAVVDPEDHDDQWHYNDFIPLLIQQEFLIPLGPSENLMDESLFRAYGFEAPS